MIVVELNSHRINARHQRLHQDLTRSRCRYIEIMDDFEFAADFIEEHAFHFLLFRHYVWTVSECA